MEILDEVWELIAECRSLDFLLLTKRPGNIPGSLPESWGPHGWPNVWLGVSVESGEESCICAVLRRPVWERLEVLAEVASVVHFVSYEPATGSPRIGDVRWGLADWIIYGGESGAGRRPEGHGSHRKAWARQIRDYSIGEDIAFWHKQSSAFRPGQGVELDGEIIQELPTPRVGSPILGQRSLFGS